MIRKYFNKLDIMEMTEEEAELYFYIDKLNKRYIIKQVENKSAAKFKKEDPNAYMILTKKTTNSQYKYQVTFFYKDDPTSHKDCKNLKETINRIYDYLPNDIKYLNNIETI
jgi:hypothetical protein